MGNSPLKDDIVMNMRCLAAIDGARILDTRRLPALATWLLAHGLETKRIVELAGMDLQPFSPVDASELFDEALFALSVLPFERAQEIRIALGAAAAVHLDGKLTTEQLLSLGTQMAIASDYAADVMGLYGLKDEWDGDWGRDRNVIAVEVREVALEALRRTPEVLACDAEFLVLALGAAPSAS